MTSKLTREQAEDTIEGLEGMISRGVQSVYLDMAIAGMRQLIATLDSEPVAVVELSDYVTAAQLVGEGPARKAVHELYEGALRIGDKLYRHAQPAPVVPEEATPDSIEILASARRRDHAVFQWDEDQRNAAADSWNACRAAMLQELQKSAGAEATCRSNENVQVLTTINPAPTLDLLPKNAESLTGNSPANPDCWCRTCRPVVLNDMRFVVCPDCGNKRCPRANDHRNACTGSNELGQEGSAYPADPQEVK